ncbi:MAG: exosortase system-associated protein, TIGR04073 family [Candidatus Omnitrophica bacterium]|nr:exosortase system-associated protein, TIGR04073 family [Candidatus Omnitrophota bacterium]
MKTMLMFLLTVCMISTMAPLSLSLTHDELYNYKAIEEKADPMSKLGRGMSNASSGWMEVLYYMQKGADKSGLFGVISSLPEGLMRSVQRTTAGVVEVATFPLKLPPKLTKEGEYDPMVEPEYVMPELFDRRDAKDLTV